MQREAVLLLKTQAMGGFKAKVILAAIMQLFSLFGWAYHFPGNDREFFSTTSGLILYA